MPLLLRCRFNEYADKFMYNSPPLPNGVLRKIVRKDIRELEHQKISSHVKLIILNKNIL